MATRETALPPKDDLSGIKDGYEFGFHDPENYAFKAKKGLSSKVVEEISAHKQEPQWMREFRLKALEHFEQHPMPKWAGGMMDDIDFQNIHYFVRASEKQSRSWDEVPEDIKNTFDKLGIPEAERKYLAGVGAQYECLAGDTIVYTARGPVPIRETRPNDTVFSLDESTNRLIPARVRANAHKGKRPVYKVSVGTRDIRATGNHPFLCLVYERGPAKQRGRYRREWRYLRDLREGDLVAVSKHLPDVGESIRVEALLNGRATHFRDQPIAIPKTTSPPLMWWLGVYLGDGFIHRSDGRKRRVEVALPAEQTELRAAMVGETKGLFQADASDRRADRLTVGATQLAELIEDLGFGGNAHTKRLPAWVYSLPRQERLALLAGYIDSDGYVRDHHKNKDVILTSANHELLNQVRGLALGCGLQCSNVAQFSYKLARSGDSALGHRLMISGDVSHLPFRNPARAERTGRHKFTHDFSSAKGTTFRSHVNEDFGFVRIREIEPDGEADVYDIEVDGPHNFVAEGIIVHNSEVVYHQVREDLEKQGVIFKDMDTGLREHEDLVREHWATVIPPNDNKLAALNSAVWSGGSFVYVPPGVHVEMPLQAYFRINTENMGQFERTLIIADEGSFVTYLEGCTAPTYTTDSLHSAVVEIVVKPGARVRYTTIQNWSHNVYNLVTKRSVAQEGATMEWIDGNLGCLAQGSTVTTPDGVKPIERLSLGEEVLSYDEQCGELCFRPVTAKRYAGMQPVRTVELGKRQIRVTDNHPFLSFRHHPDRPKKLGRYRLGYVRADEVERVIVPRRSIDYGVPHRLVQPVGDPTAFVTSNQYERVLTAVRARPSRLTAPEVTTEELMWLFGFFTGDGDIERAAGKSEGVTRWARVGFSCPHGSRGRERLVATVEQLLPSKPTERSDRNHLRWNSVELADLFEHNGFVSGALNKYVPEWVLNTREPERLAFVAGYLDADGCVIASKRVFQLKSANRALLEGVSRILTSLGITGRLYCGHAEPRETTIMGNRTRATASYALVFPLDARIAEHCSPDLREKATAVPSAKLRHHRRIGRSSIELPECVEVDRVEVGDTHVTVPTWDIEVEGTGNFVSEGFIVHNSKLTMKYPSVYLMGPEAHGEILSIAFAGKGQHQDAGGKVVHVAPKTTSTITSKSISKDGGRASYRGLLEVAPGAKGSKSKVVCDALLLDEDSRSDTYPTIRIGEDDVDVGHEATVSKIGEEQLFYLRSRGLTEEEASGMIVGGFIEPFTRELPMEYAVEMNRLIELQMEGSIG